MIKYLRWLSDPQWVVAIGTIFLGLVALFSDWIKSLFYYPKIVVIGEPIIVKQTSDLSVLRVLLRNKGKGSAYGIEANVISIVDPDNCERKDFTPSPLNWTHSQLWEQTKPKILRDMYPYQNCYLDIADLYIENESREPKLRISIQAGQELEHWSQIKIGKTKIKIVLYEVNGRNYSLILILNWEGTYEIKKCSIESYGSFVRSFRLFHK